MTYISWSIVNLMYLLTMEKNYSSINGSINSTKISDKSMYNMFQDGVIERNIPSVELYPIHHLDELEFFPGDFVIRNTGI